MGYQIDFRLEEAVADREGTGGPASFDSHEWPRMQQVKTREQECQGLPPEEPQTQKQHKLEWWRGSEEVGVTLCP